MANQFTAEAHAELVAMYTGMALQGLLASPDSEKSTELPARAVRIAAATVDALAQYHERRAEAAQAEYDAAKAQYHERRAEAAQAEYDAAKAKIDAAEAIQEPGDAGTSL